MQQASFSSIQRICFIDILKGILILFVILGHVLLGTLESNLLRYIIYAFHMPLFFSISGYLLNYKKLREISFIALVKKYIFRIIIPFFIAFVFFNAFIFLSKGYIAGLYYHLWFIPCYLYCIFTFWILSKISKSIILPFVFSVVVYIFFSFVPKFDFINSIKDILHPSYIFWFCLGMLYRHYKFEYKKINNMLLVIFVLIYTCIFFIPDILPYAKIPCSFLLNMSLIYFVLSHLYYSYENPFLYYIGVNSMGIYIWHVVPILIAKYLFQTVEYYYIACIVFLLIFFFIFNILNKISFIKKYIFGGVQN